MAMTINPTDAAANGQQEQPTRARRGAQRTSKLNSKRLAFCREYMIDHNAARAAIRAGYSAATARQIGHELLTFPNVAEEVRRLEALSWKKYDISVDRIAAELAKIAFSNAQDYVRIVDGEPVVDFSDVPRDKMAAITEMTVEDFTDGRGDDARDVRRVKFKMADKRAALVDLGKFKRMFVERTEHTGADGKPIEVEDATKNGLIDRLLAVIEKTSGQGA